MKRTTLLLSTLLCFSSISWGSLQSCKSFFSAVQTVTPASAKNVLGWPYGMNDFLTLNSPDGRFQLVYDGLQTSSARLLDNQTGEVVLGEASSGRNDTGFSEDSHFLFITDYDKWKNDFLGRQVLKKYNIQKKQFEDDVTLPAGVQFSRAIDENTFIVRRRNGGNAPQGYGVLKIGRGLLFDTKNVTDLQSSFAKYSDPKGIQFVVVNPEKTFAAVVTTYANYVDIKKEKMGRLWSQYQFEVFDLQSGKKVFSSDAIPALDWQRHTDITGLDEIYFKNNSLIISGYERTTGHTIYNLVTKQVSLLSEADAAQNQLPVIRFDGKNLNFEVTTTHGERKNLTVPFDGFQSSGWGLQEQFQYTFLQNGEVLVVSKDDDFQTAVNVVTGTTLTYEETAQVAGKEKSLSFLSNIKTLRYNP